MTDLAKPTIQGLYVKAHIEALRKQKGEEGVKLLQTKLGFPLDFADDADIFLDDEERIIDESYLILHPDTRAEELPYLSGRMHFENWMATEWSKQLFGLLPPDFKYMMLHLDVIGIKIYKNFPFKGEELGPTSVKISTANNYYHPDHFRGVYEAWMSVFGLVGTTTVEKVGEHSYDYVVTWQAPASA